MPASVTSPADVLNLTLARIGYPGRIGNLYDGSKAAKKALDLYAQTRDQLMRQNDWGFAERNLNLVLLKSAPPGGYIPPTTWSTAYPPLPWLFEYARPTDCLKIRAIKGVPLFLPVMDPQPVVFTEANDTVAPATGQVILCNVANAVLTYSGQVTDPTAWEPDFVEALSAELERPMALLLVQLETAKLIINDAPMDKAIAEMERG
jgi:hypothetical protein